MTTALAEINVVPLVDVMLVLLIIFMVAAPMMQQGLKVDLPQQRRPRRCRHERADLRDRAGGLRAERLVQIGNESIRLDVLAERDPPGVQRARTSRCSLRSDGR